MSFVPCHSWCTWLFPLIGWHADHVQPAPGVAMFIVCKQAIQILLYTPYMHMNEPVANHSTICSKHQCCYRNMVMTHLTDHYRLWLSNHHYENKWINIYCIHIVTLKKVVHIITFMIYFRIAQNVHMLNLFTVET